MAERRQCPSCDHVERLYSFSVVVVEASRTRSFTPMLCQTCAGVLIGLLNAGERPYANDYKQSILNTSQLATKE